MPTKQNPNRPISPPSKPIDADRIRQTHNRPDPKIEARHDTILEQLDGADRTRGGRRDGK